MRRTAVFSTVLTIAVLGVAPSVRAAGPGSSEGGALGADPPSAPANPGRSSGYTFYGSGWGHGIGMSQWGAYGLAQDGWSARRILTRFYSGTRVIAPRDRVRRIRIGLTYDRRLIHMTARVAPVRLWVGAPHSGTSIAKIPVGQTWTIGPRTSGFAIRNAAGSLVGDTTWGGASLHVYATFAGSGAHVFVPEADAIYGHGFTYTRGSFEFNLYHCSSGRCLERLILPIGFEQYLLGLGEVPSSWPLEALKAQAIGARTYATYSVKHYGLRSYCNCHLTDGSEDQTYVGYDKEVGTGGGRWVRAVHASARRIVAYHGRAIQAFYAASDGGHSESVEDAWHGGDPSYAIPYLKGVCDPGEYTTANPWTNWRLAYTASEVTSRLAPYTGGIGTVTAFARVSRGSGGRIVRATVRGSNGTTTVSGTEMRAALLLPDDRVWINRNKNVVGAIRAKYDALDCRPGLPMSPVGTLPGGSRQKFHTGAIYRNTRKDLSVWMKGPLYQEYVGVGGATGRLGLPTSTVVHAGKGAVRVRATGGNRMSFERGRIYARPSTGAHALWGDVLKAYVARGGPAGALGYPVTRVHPAGAGARAASFEHGRIVCSAGGSCRVGPA